MKNTLAMLLLGLVPVLSQQTVFASPEDDRKAFVEYFQSRFPDVPFAATKTRGDSGRTSRSFRPTSLR
jgi:hypothetical protein